MLNRNLTAGPQDHLLPNPTEIPVDDVLMASLQKKYDFERDKRINARPEGNEQYINILDLAEDDSRFARMIADPYPQIETPHPLTDEVECCVVGGGYGGLTAAARLVEAGINPKNVRLLDSGGDVGGTWYWNRYPGAMCDIESYVYMPMCEELGYVPTEKYAHQPEIYRHSKMIMEKYNLYENASFGARVTGMDWDDTKEKWLISTDKDDRFYARFVIMNFGLFTQPKLPKVPGVDSFKGHMFHTSRWDYDYTGGSSSGNLYKLKDKRVAIIGTGATAIQVVPHLGDSAKQLYVFQRTPSPVDVRNNRHTTPEYAKEFLSKPGWQKERRENFIQMVQSMKGPSNGVDLVDDGWTEIISNLMLKSQKFLRDEVQKAKETGQKPDMKQIARKAMDMSRVAQFQQMEKIRKRTDLVVKDKATADALKPWYHQFCKRPCFKDDYLTTFNKPNVKLVDTNGLGISAITEKGVVVNGQEYEVDVIVLATGFEQPGLDTGGRRTAPHRLGYDIIGRGKQSLAEKWKPQGPKSFEAYYSSGFPNIFFQNAPFDVLTVNFTHRLDEASIHFAHIVSEMKKRSYQTFDVKHEVEEEFIKRQLEAVRPERAADCTPGYYNNEGVGQDEDSNRLAGVPHVMNPLAWFATLEKRRKDGTALNYFNLSSVRHKL